MNGKQLFHDWILSLEFTTFHTLGIALQCSPGSSSLVQRAVFWSDIVALGCAKGLLHDWIWADNSSQECGGMLWHPHIVLTLINN